MLRLIHQIANETVEKLNISGVRFQSDAIKILHDTSEFCLIQMFQDVSLVSTVAKRQTIAAIDIKLVRYLRGKSLVSIVSTNSLEAIRSEVLANCEKIETIKR